MNRNTIAYSNFLILFPYNYTVINLLPVTTIFTLGRPLRFRPSSTTLYFGGRIKLF